MKRSTLLILASLSIFSVGTYLIVSAFYYHNGFPLDDAWIHQTYARNLVLFGEWAFSPGQLSGGSTSPLWTVLLSFSYLFHIPPLVWTFSLGVIILWGLALLAEFTVRQEIDAYRARFPWIGSIVIFEWHLVWAAASGMETLLFSFFAMWVLVSLLSRKPRFLVIGILIGISIWLRPDGLTLLGPAFMVGLLEKVPLKQKFINLSNIIIGFSSIFIFYLLFTLALTGNPWPTTFYAKQAEYLSVVDYSIVERFGKLLIQLFVGVGIILLPGIILTTIDAIIKKKWNILAGLIWLVGLVGLYAWRLPVSYQHGRYLIPSMVVLFIFSFVGVNIFFKKNRSGWYWSLGKVWKLAIGLVLIIFWGYGSIVYAKDVAFIESEMVVTARWVAKNIPENSLIASHDIGALGYFGNHKIVDLAGLISPDVIPFLQDENLLKRYMDQKMVDYLITFPSWYPLLIKGLPEIYQTGGSIAPLMGGENLVIYQWLDNR